MKADCDFIKRIMSDRGLNKPTELCVVHGDVYPRQIAGICALTALQQPRMADHPVVGSFNYLITRQRLKWLLWSKGFDGLDGPFWTDLIDAMGEGVVRLVANNPENTQPSGWRRKAGKRQLCVGTIGGVRGRDLHGAGYEARCIRVRIGWAAFDALVGIVTKLAVGGMKPGALIVENPQGRPIVSPENTSNKDGDCAMNHSRLIVHNPRPEDMTNGFQLWVRNWKILSRTAAFKQIEDGINDPPTISVWTSKPRSLRKSQFGASSLDVRKVRPVIQDFHRGDSTCAKQCGPQQQKPEGRCKRLFSRGLCHWGTFYIGNPLYLRSKN